GVGDSKLARERLQRRFERAMTRDLELEIRQLLPRLGERAQQDDVALDRDQAPDAEQARHVSRVWGRLAVWIDAVVDDLERLVVEGFEILQVAGKAAGNPGG